jgi:glutaredoxin 3
LRRVIVLILIILKAPSLLVGGIKVGYDRFMNIIRLYTTSYCPYCDAAKRLFKSLGLAYEEINLESQHEERQRLSEENAGWRTVPMIFVGDKFLGGFNDVKALHDKGAFLPLVNGSKV